MDENYDLSHESPAIIRDILLHLKSGTNEAIQYFENLLKNQSQHAHTLSTSIYTQLGYLKQKAGNTNSANSMYEQAMNRGTMEINLYLYYLDQIARETKQYSKLIEYSSAAINNLSVDHPQSSFFQEQLENARKNLNN